MYFYHLLDDLLIVLSRIVGDETSTSTQSIKNREVFQYPDLDTVGPLIGLRVRLRLKTSRKLKDPRANL